MEAKIFVLIFSIIIIIITIIIVKQYIKCKKLNTIRKANIEKAYEYLHKITYEKLSLEGLYCIFKEIAQNLDISFILNPHGIFRAKSLDGCRMSDIYLGNIYGLWTYPLNTWINTSSISKVDLDIITNQFKNILIDTLNTYIKHEKGK